MGEKRSSTKKMEETGLVHIGIAVKSISSAIPFFVNLLNLSFVKTETILSQHVRVAFLQAGSVAIELLEPLSSEGAVSRFIQKNGEGVHHLAFSTPDLERRIANIRSKGFTFVGNPPNPGAEGKKTAFLHPQNTHGVLIELIENSRNAGKVCFPDAERNN